MNKIECEKLLEEYKEIKSRIDKSTRLYPNVDLTVTPPINPVFPSGDVMERLNKIVAILKNNCKECINPENYLEIEAEGIDQSTTI